jgi:D-alanyl-D-alanine carboxypeptidase (penicillin-binding protein 5/6)
VTYTGADIGIPSTTSIDLVATEDIEKAGWFKLFLRAIGNFFSDLFGSIKNLF